MPGPDMVFTESEVAQPGSRHRHSRGPDMVFTTSEVEAMDRAAVRSTPPAAPPAPPTIEAADSARRNAAPSAPNVAPVASATATDLVNGTGAVNDSLNAINTFRQTGEILPSNYAGPFMRNGNVGPMAPGQVRMPQASWSDRGMGALGVLAGGAQAINSFRQGMSPNATALDRQQAAYGVGIGSLGAAGGVATMAGQSGLSGGLGIASGALESAQGIQNLASGDEDRQANGAQQLMHGLLGGAGSATSLAGPAAAPATAVLQAATAGVSVGTTLQQRAEVISQQRGTYGVDPFSRVSRGVAGANDQVHNASASQDAANRGAHTFQTVSNWIYNQTGNNTLSDIGGGIVGGVHTLGRSVWNTFSNLW